jgi:hypothetical protein
MIRNNGTLARFMPPVRANGPLFEPAGMNVPLARTYRANGTFIQQKER